MLYDSNKMNKMEYNMYNYWFKTFKNHFNFNINYIIYLRVDPILVIIEFKLGKEKKKIILNMIILKKYIIIMMIGFLIQNLKYVL